MLQLQEVTTAEQTHTTEHTAAKEIHVRARVCVCRMWALDVRKVKSTLYAVNGWRRLVKISGG